MNQIINVVVNSEAGCNIHDEEFTHTIVGIIGGLCLDEIGGQSDAYLVSECVKDWIADNSGILGSNSNNDVMVDLFMHSEHEQQDNGLIKYFVVDNHEVLIV